MSKKYTLYYVIYFCTYALLAIGYTQYAAYLTSVGYSISQRGILLSSYAITTIIFQLFFGFLSDKYQMIKKVLIIGLMIFSISVVFLFSIQHVFFFLHFVLVALSGGVCNANMGLIDSWLYAQNDNSSSSYSFIRAFGSLGWAIASFVIAPLIGLCGYQGLGIVCLGLSILTCGFVLYKDQQTKQVSQKKSFRFQDIKELFSYQPYMILVIILFFYYCATATNSCSVIDKILELQATPAEIGLRWSLFGLVEIPIYFIGVKMMKKLGSYRLLILGGFVIAGQFFLFSIATTVTQMIVISCLQMLAGPIVILTSRTLSYEYAPDHLKSTALLVGMSLYQGTTMLFIPMIGGYVSEIYGVNMTLMSVSLLSCIGIIFAFVLKKKMSITTK